jgi:hypothetical protein
VFVGDQNQVLYGSFALKFGRQALMNITSINENTEGVDYSKETHHEQRESRAVYCTPSAQVGQNNLIV